MKLFTALASLVPLLLVTALTSCRVEPTDPDLPAPQAEELGPQMGQFVDQLIERSLAATREEAFQFEDGRPGTRRVPATREGNVPTASWTPQGSALLTTPGEQVAELELDRRPWAILVDNAGTAVAARAEDILIVEPDGSRRTLPLPGVTSLQWNADGSLLLVDSPDVKHLLLWPSLEPGIDLLEEGFRGRLHFSPQGEGIWQVADIFDPDPSNEVRALVVSIKERMVGAANERDVITSPLPLAAFGTLPQVGNAWGHRIRAGMILPRPAPIWILDDSLKPGIALTDPVDRVDFAPMASQSGRVVFLRARRLIDGDHGLQLAPHARAWLASLIAADSGDKVDQRPLTAEPTYGVAISPNGEWIVTMVERHGSMQLVRSAASYLIERDLGESQRTVQEFESTVGRVVNQLREAWNAEPWQPILESETIAYEQPLSNASEVLPRMADVLHDALTREHGLQLSQSRQAIATLDAWLREADGLLEEENATILAVGALYGELLAREPGVAWDFRMILPALSNDLTAATETEGELYRLHSPFLAAREAISGRISLAVSAAEALADGHRAVGLVENFSPRARAAFALAELERVGVPMEGTVAMEHWERLVQEETGNLVANEGAWSAANARGEAGVAFAAAMNMAETDPANPRFLLRFARELILTGLDEPAGRLLNHVAIVAPHDPEVRLAVATAYLDLFQWEEAERRLQDIARDFPAEQRVVSEHMEVLRELRDDSTGED